jgi:glycosyltransferase involved in cell wall biosynthesis
VADDDEIWGFLSERSGLSPQQVRGCKIVTEISRTDVTKRKDVLIRAFAQVHQKVPDSLLVVSIDDQRAELAQELKSLIQASGVADHTAVVGSIWRLLPTLYAITDVYCTPSIMEGFGMSAQEAAATGVPVVASDLVPFAKEYLAGAGAILVPANDIDGFAHALERVLTDDSLQKEMGENAYRATIPYFTWHNQVSAFLQEIGEDPVQI